MKPAITIVTIILAIFGIVIGLIAYSYTQIQVSLDDVSFAGLDWASASLSTILKLGINLLTGNILGAALTLITGIKLNLIFALSNHGVFPVYIPDLSYTLSINGVNIGQGQSTVDATINPGETKQLPILQDFQINSLKPAADSIIATGGMVNLQVSGTAYFKFLWFTVPVPFQSTKQISLMDEIRNHFSSIRSQNQYSNNSYQPPIINTNISLQTSDSYAGQDTQVKLSGRLTDQNGNGINNALVQIKQDKTLAIDPVLAQIYTDSSGYFSMTGTFPVGTMNIYAVFSGSSSYSNARSDEITMVVSPVQTLQSQQNVPSGNSIANSAYKVSAGTFYPINFNLPCAATVTGAFSAQATLGNNIIVYIFNQSNFNNYQAGSNSATLYNSGKVASGSFNVALPSGTYYIVLSNTYSSFSTKNVGIEASYTCN